MFLVVSMYLGLMLGFMSVYSLYVGLTFYFNMKVLFLEWEIFSLMGMELVMTFIFDWVSLVFMGFVMFISSMVLIYSTNYMEGDKFIYRFIMMIYLFVLSMLFLITSPNLISILLGWDGLGLVSYCLVIYYQNVKSNNAGMLTILSNRVGDVAILLSIAWLSNFGSWNFFFLQFVLSESDLYFVLLMMVLAGMTKSAQIPFSAWLPAAMAAPTPVSALVHSSTLVTAGVYLLIRFSDLLNITNFLFIMGVFTMFMSGLSANFETDFKKIIALSTLSQLGVMMMILSLGMKELAFFHLLSHALFKSLLFLCAGVYIHSMGDIQDIRFLGGLNLGCPQSSFFFMGCSMSLCGFPFMSGFYSKDLILESYMMGEMNFFMCLFIILGTFLTVTYSVRLGFIIFFKNLGVKKNVYMDESGTMIYPMSFLYLGAVSGGSVMSWICFPQTLIFMPLIFKMMILLVIMLLLVLGLNYFMNFNFEMIKEKLSELIYYMGLMWFMPYLSVFLTTPALVLGAGLIKYLDQGWVEKLGSQGLFALLTSNSKAIDYMNLFNLKNYLMWMFMFIFFYMVI